jgi:hypothetical protein
VYPSLLINGLFQDLLLQAYCTRPAAAEDMLMQTCLLLQSELSIKACSSLLQTALLTSRLRWQ